MKLVEKTLRFRENLVLLLMVVSGLFLISSPCKAAVAGGTVIDQDGNPMAGSGEGVL